LYGPDMVNWTEAHNYILQILYL